MTYRIRRKPAPVIGLMDAFEFNHIRARLRLSHTQLADITGSDERTSKRWSKDGVGSRAATVALRLALASRKERHVLRQLVRTPAI